MTRLPELEQQLFAAALGQQSRRRRWWRISLLGGSATFAIVGVAGAVSLFLPEGDPVPPAQHVSVPEMDPGTSRVLSVRAADPAGGLPWGIGVARSQDGHVLCAQVGRVQQERLGVIGRDGTFNNDGKFHPLSIGANQSGVCGGFGADFRLATDDPPIPSSGFTGSFLSAAGGCREDVPASTMSPAIRRRLKNVPVCDADSLRLVKYGFAGRNAVKVRYAGHTLRANPEEYGAYLFVLRPKAKRPTLVITYKDGTTCRMTVGRPCP
jgi:hypothetical protein